MNNTNLPPADAPDWGDAYNFAWFRHHHLKALKTCAKAIKKEYKKHPSGKGLPQDAIKNLLDITAQFILFHPWLPDTAGGTGEMDNLIEARNKFESGYLNKPADNGSYWQAQEIEMMAAEIFNYMDTMCEDE